MSHSQKRKQIGQHYEPWMSLLYCEAFRLRSTLAVHFAHRKGSVPSGPIPIYIYSLWTNMN